MVGFRKQRRDLLEYGSDDNGGQVRLRTLDIIETENGVSAARVCHLQSLDYGVVGGGIGQDPRCVQEEQRVDEDGNGGDHDAWEWPLSRESREGQDEEQAEPDETEDGLLGFCDVHGYARGVGYAVASDQADGEDGEERVKAASQHA
ncbi:hypothetical protein PG993_015032 [Apiospora rasikravindrae]|uniref:Uncharacterized protein n=1 Tax=Apiospora rasikravindrae TaxID=990691 RepID=A0ABR1RPF9_9PEZI